MVPILCALNIRTPLSAQPRPFSLFIFSGSHHQSRHEVNPSHRSGLTAPFSTHGRCSHWKRPSQYQKQQSFNRRQQYALQHRFCLLRSAIPWKRCLHCSHERDRQRPHIPAYPRQLPLRISIFARATSPRESSSENTAQVFLWLVRHHSHHLHNHHCHRQDVYLEQVLGTYLLANKIATCTVAIALLSDVPPRFTPEIDPPFTPFANTAIVFFGAFNQASSALLKCMAPTSTNAGWAKMSRRPLL